MSVLQLKDRGQDVINQLSELLVVSDLHLFGLSVVKGMWFPSVFFFLCVHVKLLTEPFFVCLNDLTKC